MATMRWATRWSRCGRASILDPAGVLCTALRSAASAAAMALTTEALVLKRKPRLSTEP